MAGRRGVVPPTLVTVTALGAPVSAALGPVQLVPLWVLPTSDDHRRVLAVLAYLSHR